MKGTIVKCLQGLVVDKFGKEQWEEICNRSGFPTKGLISLSADIEDATALELITNTCAVLDITLEQAADAFGDYWVNDYAVEIYKSIYGRFSSAREFILGMDDVHIQVTQSIENARPPRFDYEWKDDQTLVVTYKSQRGLIDVFAGLVRGLGKHFDEPLTVTKLSDDKVQVVWS